MKNIILLIIFIVGGYYLWNYVAYSIIWSDTNAPWEQVNAFYYPDKNNLTVDKRLLNVGGLQECRDWVNDMASKYNDPRIERSDYECGIGCKPWNGTDTYVCRMTIR